MFLQNNIQLKLIEIKKILDEAFQDTCRFILSQSD